jgi:hypothetical protein
MIQFAHLIMKLIANCDELSGFEIAICDLKTALVF